MDNVSIPALLVLFALSLLLLAFVASTVDSSDRSTCSNLGMETVTTNGRIFCVDENGYLLSPRKLKRIQEES